MAKENKQQSKEKEQMEHIKRLANPNNMIRLFKVMIILICAYFIIVLISIVIGLGHLLGLY